MTGSLIPHSAGNGSSEITSYQPGGLPGAMGEPEEPGIPWPRYFSALRRYRWLIAILTIAGLGIGIAATRFIKKAYTASATVFVEKAPEQGGPIRPVGFLEGNGWGDLLRSSVVLDSTALRMRLYLDFDSRDSAAFANFALKDEFATGDFALQLGPDGKQYEIQNRQGARIDAGLVGDSVGRRLGFNWLPDPKSLQGGRRIRFSVITLREASADLSKHLNLNMPADGNFMNLSLSGQNPQRIANTLNTIAEQFVGIAADLKKRKLQVLSSTLEEQVRTTRAELERAENSRPSVPTPSPCPVKVCRSRPDCSRPSQQC